MTDILKKPFITSLLCFLSGSICAFGVAPYNIWPVFLVGFGVLYWAIDRAKNKRMAFAYGWLWAFGYFVFGLYWIGNALLVDGNPYKWAWPLAVCGLPALLAFFTGAACLIVKCACDLRRWHGYLGFAAVLSLFEYARGHAFTGFPWNLYGYTWIDFPQIAQLASYESVYFLTFLTLFWLSIAGFLFIYGGRFKKRYIAVLMIISFIAGVNRGAEITPQRIAFHDLNIKIIQPNTDQSEKWQRDKMVGHFEHAIRLSQANENDDKFRTLIIWPETTLSPQFLNAPYYREQIVEMLQGYKGEAILMSGALRRDDEGYYNSLLTIDADGQIDRIYNKSHLVPFGEYIPFQKWIPLAPVTQFQGFKKGDGPTSMSIFDKLSYSPLICYEVLFPGKAIDRKKSRPNFIVNVTNDAWYGDSAGPHQHLVKAKFRAIEEGVPVLRAANTGISAIIDPYGRIINRSDLFTRQNIEAKLPKSALITNKSKLFSILLFPLSPLALIAIALINTCFKRPKS